LELRLSLEFSNGYRTSANLSAGDCYVYCEGHAARDVESFRQALLREARRIYARMLREQRRAWFREFLQRLANGVERAMRSRRATWALYGHDARLHFEEGTPQAQEQGLRLLTENLTAPQLEQYEIGQYFDVTGGTTGKRNRVHRGRSMNIEQFDDSGRRVCGWCFFPKGRLVTGDIMLAQKVALELYELEALQVAHKIDTARLGLDTGCLAAPATRIRDQFVGRRRAGYAISQQKRNGAEESFGWGKAIGGLAQCGRCCAAPGGWSSSR
jgi:hypothetical protein